MSINNYAYDVTKNHDHRLTQITSLKSLNAQKNWWKFVFLGTLPNGCRRQTFCAVPSQKKWRTLEKSNRCRSLPWKSGRYQKSKQEIDWLESNHSEGTQYRKCFFLNWFFSLYRVEHQTLPVKFFLNCYRMLQDMSLKINTDSPLVLSYAMIKKRNIDSASVSVMTKITVFSIMMKKLSYPLCAWI